MTENIKAFELTVDDGRIKVPVKNNYGDEIGVFYFNPTDINILDRYNKAIEDFENVADTVSKIDVENNDELAKATEQVYAICNYIFDGDVANAFFGKINPFTPINGMLYFEKVIDSISQFISAQIDKENAQVEKRIKKYTKKYEKNKV